MTGNKLDHSTNHVECQHFGFTKGFDMRQKKRAEKPDEIGKKLGKSIADRRKALKLTQDDLAGLVEVDAETISRFERGTSLPSIQRLLVVAAALETGLGELLSEASNLPDDRSQSLAALMKGLATKDQELLLAIADLLRSRGARS